jgi:DNA polymerase (family 10)
MNNEEIARRFNQMGSLMEVRGEDSFRVRSYRMAAEAIETWPIEMKIIEREQGLAGLLEIPGVGKALAGKIVELVQTGTFDAWERLTAETPATVLDLLELPAWAQKRRRPFIKNSRLLRLMTCGNLRQAAGSSWSMGLDQKARSGLNEA